MSFGFWYSLCFTVTLSIAAAMSESLPAALQNPQGALFCVAGASAISMLTASLLNQRVQSEHRKRIRALDDIERAQRRG